jgi:hypothetical protein
VVLYGQWLIADQQGAIPEENEYKRHIRILKISTAATGPHWNIKNN